MTITISLNRSTAIQADADAVVTVDALTASAAEMPFVQALVAHVSAFAQSHIQGKGTK